MRILEAVGAAVICTVVGAAFSSALKARCKQLRLVVSLTGEMSSRIRCRAVPLPELINELTGSGVYKDSVFLKETAAYVDKGLTVQEAWVRAARSAPFFSESDRDILADIGARLGESDTDGQTLMLGAAGEMLSRSLEAAEEECRKKAGAMLRVWALCGLGAGIVII